MQNGAKPDILSAERVDTGLVVKFADGHCVFYSAAILYAAIAEAKILDDKIIAW